MKRTLMMIAALLGLFVLWYDYQQSLPPNREARNQVVSIVNGERHVNALQLQDETKNLVPDAIAARKVSSQEQLNTVLGSGTRAHMLNNVLPAWDARESGRSLRHVEAEVKGDQHSPNWVADAFEPLHVWTDPSVKMTMGEDPSLHAGPDGIDIEDDVIRNVYPTDQTSLMYDRLSHMHLGALNQFRWVGNDCHGGVCDAIVRDLFSGKEHTLPNTGKLWEIIGQVCPKDGSGDCSELDPVGSNFYVCGNHFGGALHTGINRLEIANNEPNGVTWWDLQGKWELNVEYGNPGAAKACADNPAAVIIPLTETPVIQAGSK